MNPRRHLLARGYAAIVIGLRHLIPLAWIAAVVLATIALPDLASAPTAPLEDLAAKNGAASKAAAVSTERFGFPLSTQTAVVQRNPRGLSAAAQRRTLTGARTILTHSDPALTDIRAALPITNAARDVPANERGTTAITYLFFPPDLSLDSTTETARTYSDKQLGGPRGSVVGVTGTAPARLEQFEQIEDSLPIIEAASILLIFVVVAIAFRSLGAPLVALVTAGITFGLAVRILPWAGERADVTVPKEVQPIIVVLLLGLVTDYTIFFLSGMRGRLRLGEERVPAAKATVVEVAPIVFTAGLIVAAGTAALVAGKLDFFRAFGPGLALTTLISMVVAITLVPALLGLFGGRLFGRRVREEGARAAREAREEGRPTPSEPPRPGAESTDEPGPLTRRGPLAGLMLRITKPVTAMRRTPELAREHGTAP
jgi:RND superfamily putative drug exporter